MNKDRTGIIYGINGPVVYIKGETPFRMGEMVYVGQERLIGEVISLSSEKTTIQVYEETTGLKPGAVVEGSGDAISVWLGPGIIHNIYDGIQRPLDEIAAQSGHFITRGLRADSLDQSKKWDVTLKVHVGDLVTEGR